MKARRVKHTRQELRALRKLEHAMEHVLHDPHAQDLLQAAKIALAYHYESERLVVFKETWSVLRGVRKGENDERSVG